LPRGRHSYGLSFTGHLYDALTRNSIRTYCDDTTLDIGKPIATSNSEISKIADCKKRGKLIVIPIFSSHVAPSAVRRQSNSFVQGFVDHEADSEVAPQKVETCKASLREVGTIFGFDEADVVSKIVSRILRDLPDTMQIDLSNSLVGIKSRVDEVKGILKMESNEVLFIGICGMSGIGKTTLAEAVYKDIKRKFDKSSIIENIKDISKQNDSTDLCKLQQKLLDDILNEKSIRVQSVIHGQTLLETKLRGFKVIIVLDDVNHVDQLTYLAGGLEWFGPGSRIIVTTTNRDLLNYYKMSEVYFCEEMNDDEARSLFCQSAFKQSHPAHDVLSCNLKGTQSLEVINQEPYKGELNDCFKVDPTCFRKMTKLKFLRISNIHFPEGLMYLSNDLRILEWSGCSLKSLPSMFEPKHIFELRMCSSQLQTLWKKDVELPNLRSINLSFSKDLTEIPDLTSASNLVKLNLEGCTKLTRLHTSILLQQQLRYLNLKGCTSLESLGSSRMEMEALESLLLSGCSKLDDIPEFGENMKRLEHLYVDGTRIKKLPENLGEMCDLRNLDASGTFIEELPSSIYRLKKLRLLHVNRCRLSFKMGCFLNSSLDTISSGLKEVDLSYCNISVVPDGIGLLSHLITLDLSGNEFVSLPASIVLLSKLRVLCLNNCKRLQSLPKLSLADEDMDYGSRSRFNYYVSTEGVDVSKVQASSYNNRPCVSCLNCSKLTVDKCGSNLAEKILNSYLELRTKYWMTPEAVFEIVGAGSEFPSGFVQTGSEGLILEGPWIGVAICAVISFHRVDGYMKVDHTITAHIHLGEKHWKIPVPINFMVAESETQLVFYWTPVDDFQRIVGSSQKSNFGVSFSMEPEDSNFHVTKVGVRFIRKEYIMHLNRCENSRRRMVNGFYRFLNLQRSYLHNHDINRDLEHHTRKIVDFIFDVRRQQDSLDGIYQMTKGLFKINKRFFRHLGVFTREIYKKNIYFYYVISLGASVLYKDFVLSLKDINDGWFSVKLALEHIVLKNRAESYSYKEMLQHLNDLEAAHSVGFSDNFISLFLAVYRRMFNMFEPVVIKLLTRFSKKELARASNKTISGVNFSKKALARASNKTISVCMGDFKYLKRMKHTTFNAFTQNLYHCMEFKDGLFVHMPEYNGELEISYFNDNRILLQDFVNKMGRFSCFTKENEKEMMSVIYKLQNNISRLSSTLHVIGCHSNYELLISDFKDNQKLFYELFSTMNKSSCVTKENLAEMMSIVDRLQNILNKESSTIQDMSSHSSCELEISDFCENGNLIQELMNKMGRSTCFTKENEDEMVNVIDKLHNNIQRASHTIQEMSSHADQYSHHLAKAKKHSKSCALPMKQVIDYALVLPLLFKDVSKIYHLHIDTKHQELLSEKWGRYWEGTILRKIVSKILRDLPVTMPIDLRNSLVGMESWVDEVKREFTPNQNFALKHSLANTVIAEREVQAKTQLFVSSSTAESQRYDVFMSFRGEDTRTGFTSHLYDALKRNNIKTYKDDKTLEIGRPIASELLEAIETSRIAIVVLSSDFATSKWCLEEIAKIVDCMKRGKLIVIPIFYHVSPSDVRHQSSCFKQGFTDHEVDPETAPQKVETWRAAFREVGALSGWHMTKNRDEAEVVNILTNIGLYPECGITDLKNKCLITINLEDNVWMHDLLQQMCWEILRKESHKFVAIKYHKDIEDTLSSKPKGMQTVEVINQEPYKCELNDCFIVDPTCLSKMTKLKFLRINNIHFVKGLKCLSNDLRIIEWFGCSLKSLPSTFEPKHIFELEMCCSQLKTLWKKDLELPNLRSINLSFSKYLTKIPDLTSASNLEKLNLEGCTNLTSLHASVLLLHQLRYLNLKGCTCLESLGKTPMEMEALEALLLSGCSKLQYIPEFGKNMKRLEHLYVDGTRIKKLPENLGEMCDLRNLDASGTCIEELPSSINRLKKLRLLHLNICPLSFNTRCFLNPSLDILSSCLKEGLFPTEVTLSYCNLSVIPDGIGLLCCLISLDLSGNEFVSLPSSIGLLSKLRVLCLNNCKRLQSLPKLSLVDEDTDYGPRSRFNYYVSAEAVDLSKFKASCYNNRPTVSCLNCPKLAMDKRGSNLAEKNIK
ncbi:LOW QUALITY PROTEIN: hypothetical protein M8C21_023929, partial [Ambrosia artemisiifolia]